MPECTEKMLKKQMETGDFSKVYVLYGAEKFSLAKAAQKLMAAVVGDVFPDFNLQKFDGLTASVDQIAVAAEALPFMAERKCVAVSDFSLESRNPSGVGKLTEVMQQAPDTTVFLFYHPTTVMDYKKSSKWRSFYKQVSPWADTIEFALRTKPELEKWLCAAAGRRGCQLSRGNAGYLVDQCGNDLQTLHQELEKVCAFVREGEITRKQMDQVVTKNLETTVFVLARALLAGQYDKAYQMMDLLFAQREEPVMILAALGSVYVDLYRVRAALQSGETVSSLAKTFDYKGKEFRLRNAERDVGGLSLEKLREYLDVLVDTDAALKSTRTDNRLWMEELIAKLLLISRKERMV